MHALLEDIRSQGLRLTAENGQILVTPKRLITDQIRVQIKAHKVDLLKAVNDSEWVHQAIANACQGLSMTPNQLRNELEAGGDTPDLISGELSIHGLRLAAELLSLTRYQTKPEASHTVAGPPGGG